MLLCPKTLRFSIQLLHRCILLQDCQCVLFALSEISKGAHNMLVSPSATLMLLATDSPPTQACIAHKAENTSANAPAPGNRHL